MSELDQFILPQVLLQQLYKETLVKLSDTNPEESGRAEPDTAFPSFGSNQHQLLILVDQTEANILSDEDRKYLETILKACKINLEHALVMNVHQRAKENIVAAIDSRNPMRIWLLGLEPASAQLPAIFPAFQVQQLGGRTFLWTPALIELQDKETKVRLWNALRLFFNLS